MMTRDAGQRIARLKGPVQPRWTEERAAEVARGLHQRLRRRLALRRCAVLAPLSLGVLLIVLLPWWLATRPVPAVVTPAPSAAPALAATDPAGAQLTRLSDGAQVQRLSAESELRIRDVPPAATRVEVLRGGGRFTVAPRHGRPFVVAAGQVEVSVVGTVFLVERGEAAVRVRCEHGVVRVASPGGDRLLRAGQEGVFPATGPGSRASQRAQADALLREADRERLAGHPAQAQALLLRFVNEHGKDGRAGLAAFTRGRLLQQLGQPDAAAQALAQVALLTTAEPLREDALARQVEALDQAGDAGRARQCAADYLRRYPAGARLSMVRAHGHLP